MLQKLIYLTDSKWTDVVNDMVIDYDCSKEQLCEALCYDRKMRQRVVQYSFPFIPDVYNKVLMECSNAYVEAQYDKMQLMYSKWWRKKEQTREIAEMAEEENYMRNFMKALVEKEKKASEELAVALRKKEERKKRKLAKLAKSLQVGSDKDKKRRRLRRKLE